ncbi:MAG: putative lipid II flippase FtsW [Actinomycetota bacterium]
MTAVMPRLVGNRIVNSRLVRSLVRRDAARARAARVLPRPPAYVIVCATVLVLNVVGLVMILSASSVAALSSYGSSWHFFNRQLIWSLVGAIAFLATARVDYHTWRRAAPLILTTTVVLLAVVLLPGVGVEVDGSRRWLGIGDFRMQPSELAKIALLLFGADLLTRRADAVANWRAWRPIIVVLLGLGLLVIAEPDLDSTIVLTVIALGLLLVGGARLRHLSTLAAAGAAAATALALAAPYRRARVFAFLDPWSDTANTGYQIAQSLIAIGSGGVDGAGLGAGRAKWLFLPNAHTDFIFAIIGEELGLVGCVAVLGLFAGFGLAGYHVAQHAPDRFGMLLAAGVTTWVVGQATINLGAVVGLLPVSGITLPFLSAGGSSLAITMAGAGMLANVARHTKPRPTKPRPTKPRPTDAPPTKSQRARARAG